MRAMEELIDQHGLSEELDDLLIARTGNTNFWLNDENIVQAMNASLVNPAFGTAMMP